MKSSTQKSKILGIEVDTLTRRQMLALADSRIRSGKRTCVFTPNTQMLMKSAKRPSLRHALRSADIRLPDGSGIRLGLRILGVRTSQRSCGIDFGEDIICLSAKRALPVFLLGGRQGVAVRAARALQAKHPDLHIVGTHHGYFLDGQAVIEKINAARPQILFVCLGSPRQEEWLAKNFDKLPSVRLAAALGGSLDVWSGDKHRAPQIWQKLSLEWLWRTLREPHRARIFFDIPAFLLLSVFSAMLEQKLQRRIKQ